jgi:RNA polymerase sigma-70 factor (ECF subfamily)
LARASDGDEKAFEKLMNSYMKIIYNFILMHVTLHEDAKDVLQEVMLGVWKGLSGFDKKSSFRTWIFGITRRKIADHYRKYYRNKDNCMQDITVCSEELYSDNDMDRLTEAISIRDAISTLSAEEKELVYLIFNAQLTYKEVGLLTGLPEGTIKSRMFSIRKKLKNELKEGDY